MLVEMATIYYFVFCIKAENVILNLLKLNLLKITSHFRMR